MLCFVVYGSIVSWRVCPGFFVNSEVVVPNGAPGVRIMRVWGSGFRVQDLGFRVMVVAWVVWFRFTRFSSCIQRCHISNPCRPGVLITFDLHITV